jgi:hypothetical protein
MLNAYWEPLTFDLPSVAPEGPWRRCIDTSLPSGDARESAPFVDAGHYVVHRGRSSFCFRRSVIVTPARVKLEHVPHGGDDRIGP